VKTALISTLCLSVLMALAGCSPEANTMVTAQPIPQTERPADKTVNVPVKPWSSEDGGQNEMEFNPQVDILFVVDNSDSMRGAQTNLVANIDRFASSIVKNKVIDYHIGVTSTWDSSERFAKAKTDGYQNGDLRFVTDGKGQNSTLRFLTRKEDKSLLASTLKIGVLSYAQGGPETEEFMSPIAAALDKSGHGATNDGFFRENAQLVVIILTDADDSITQWTPDQLASKLVNFKGGRGDKVAVYGALVKASDPDDKKDFGLRVTAKDHPECFEPKTHRKLRKGEAGADPGCFSGFGPVNLEQLIVLANSAAGTPKEIRENFIMSLNGSSFGSDLAKIGDTISAKTLAKTIRLDQLPKMGPDGKPMIRVRYGTPEELAQGKGRIIPNSSKGGWLYDPQYNTIYLAGDIKYEDAQEGSRFAVDILAVTIKQ
jgi:hypothetical protein